jgi:AraC-like DNA-binding protein
MRIDDATIDGGRGVYGRRLGDCFGLRDVPAYVRIETSAIAITRIRCDRENNGLTAPLPVEDAFLITVHLADCAHHDLWIDGQARRTGPLTRGAISIYDLRTSPVVNSTSAFRNLHMYLPCATLRTIAQQEHIAPFDEIVHEPGIGLSDPVLAGLGLSLESAFENPGHVTRIFVDHVTTAITARLTRVFRPTARYRDPRRAVLSAEQERLAKELLSANLDGDVGTADLADACGMSVPAFRRAFRRATGTAPHHWLLQRRLDRAADLLRRTRLDLATVARRSGFADVRHLRRVFRVLRNAAPEAVRPF